MKKSYITPAVNFVEVELHSPFMNNMSVSSKEISNEEHVGLVKGESSSSSRYNVWDDDWSAE